MMKESTKEKLREAQQYCDDEDKSTEFMLQYMQDCAGVNLDCVLNFIEKDWLHNPNRTNHQVKRKKESK